MTTTITDVRVADLKPDSRLAYSRDLVREVRKVRRGYYVVVLGGQGRMGKLFQGNPLVQIEG